MNVYLDNAATTPLHPEALEAMKIFLTENFGNPSSTHAHGRKARMAVEVARKKTAELMSCTPGEIIFTSGGTEADNAIICGAIEKYAVQHLITSPVEHHAVLHTLRRHSKKLKLDFVKLDEKGNVDTDDLEKLLKKSTGLVSLMYGNNEIGNLLDVKRVGELCRQYEAYFHSDAVQAVGHLPLSFSNVGIHGAAASAHKFHGPKGIGFMYINKEKKIYPFVTGGSQEREMRGGTENVSGIIGLAKALELSCLNMEKDRRHILSLKKRMIDLLKEKIDGVSFNGESENMEKSLSAVLSVSLPPSPKNDMLLFQLDLQGVSASGGSACSSGAASGSHVIQAVYPNSERAAIRFSFSACNTEEEIDFAAEKLANILQKTS